MRTLNFYIFKNLAISTGFVGIILICVVFLSQSLRFLDLIISSGASGSTFWILTFLVLPRFFEIILPLALVASTIFVYTRMNSDSELVIAQASGRSPFSISTPALVLGGSATVFLLFMTLWVAPTALSNMQSMRQMIRANLSSILFREGVFTQAGDGLTVYIRNRNSDGALQGLIIHDHRDKSKNPYTILARQGTFLSSPDGYKVLVYDGTRQEFDKDKKTVSRLNFDQYTIDLPDSEPVRKRWSEPDERTIGELIQPDLNNERDIESLRDFRVEIHRRFTSPLLALVFPALACAFLLSGKKSRYGQNMLILGAVVSCVLIQSFFLIAFNMARHSDWGLVLMYILIVLPLLGSFLVLNEKFKTLAALKAYIKDRTIKQ